MRPELARTLTLAVIAAPLCVVAGALMAHRWRRQMEGDARSAAPWTLAVLVTPPAVLALGWVVLGRRLPLSPLRDTSVPLVLAYLSRFAPLAAVVLLIGELRRSRGPEAAAQALGVTGLRYVRLIAWPARRRGLLAALVLCGLLVATELEMTLLLIPAGTTTAGVRLYTLIHSAPDARVAAAALATLAALLLPVVLLGALTLTRRGDRR